MDRSANRQVAMGLSIGGNEGLSTEGCIVYFFASLVRTLLVRSDSSAAFKCCEDFSFSAQISSVRSPICSLESLSSRRSKRQRLCVMPVFQRHCPHCFSTVIQRSRRHGFPETLLRRFCIHRYRCCDCAARVYGFRTPFPKTLQAVKPHFAWRTLLDHIFRLK